MRKVWRYIERTVERRSILKRCQKEIRERFIFDIVKIS